MHVDTVAFKLETVKNSSACYFPYYLTGSLVTIRSVTDIVNIVGSSRSCWWGCNYTIDAANRTWYGDR